MFNIHGWIGGAQNQGAANRVNHLVEVVLGEAKHYDRCPVVILGDLNANIHNLYVLQQVLEDRDFIDVANDKHVYDEPPKTCFVQNKNGTRKGYMFVSFTWLPFVSQFRVTRGNLPVHSTWN